MSDLYDPQYTRGGYGKYNKHKSFVSMEAGTDAFFLEDEANEMQWIQNEARADIIRKQYYSGIFQKQDDDVVFEDMSENSFSVKPMTVNINGYFVNVSGNAALNMPDKDMNYITLPAPPESGKYFDFVYIEMCFKEIKYTDTIWHNGNENNGYGDIKNTLFDNRMHGETCRRVQLQWKIRSARIPDNGKTFDESMLATYVPAFGSKTLPTKYGFWNAMKNLDNASESDDYGLWIAGFGNTDLETIDGYSYAIPLFKVIRHNTSGYTEQDKAGASLFKFGEHNTADRPDGKYANIIYEDDVIDLRNIIKIDNFEQVLTKNFDNVLLNDIPNYEPTIFSTLFGIDSVYTDDSTVLYCNCNKDMGTSNIVGDFSFVPSVEEDGVLFNASDTCMIFPVAASLLSGTLQFIVNSDNLDKTADLFSINNDSTELLYAYVQNSILNIGSKNASYFTFDISNYVVSNNFIHFAVAWSKDSNVMYLMINNKIVKDSKLADDFVTDITSLTIGKTSYNFGSKNNIFDEIELSKEIKTHFNQIPYSITNGTADFAIDTQYGRRNYTRLSNIDYITMHLTEKSDGYGSLSFTIEPPLSSTFINLKPEIYFDNESVPVDNIEWTLKDNIWSCQAENLGADITYNFVVLTKVKFAADQGIKHVPHKAHLARCEKCKTDFMAVRDNSAEEAHRIFEYSPKMVYNYNNALVAYNPYINKNIGFCTGLRLVMKLADENKITIDRSIYTKAQGVYSVYYIHNNSRIQLLSTSEVTDDTITIHLTENYTGTVYVVLVTNLNNVVYSTAKFGIEELCQYQPILLYGDGKKTEFIYRAETKILSSLAELRNNGLNNIVYVNGVATDVSVSINGTFLHITFAKPPVNKADITFSIISEYDPLRSERVEFIYEMINIDYDMVSELNNQSITYCDDKIFVTTDGFGAYPIDTQDREVCNITYLPIESDELTIQPYNITPTATNMQVPINYANPLAGGNSLISFNNIYVNKPQAAVHGYTGTTIDYKTYFSLTTLPVSLPHLNVLPMLIKKDGSLKMAIFTTYENGNNIYISGNKSTMNVYNLEHNYLLR
jgi:hypothetical protein